MENLKILETLRNNCFRGIIEQMEVQVEVISKKSVMEQYKYQELRKRIELQYHFNHENIQKLYYYEHDRQNVYIISEYMSHGCLSNWIKYSTMNEKKLKQITLQLSLVLDYLIKRQIYTEIEVKNIYFDCEDNVKLSNLQEIHHKSNKSLDYRILGYILYHCIYKRAIKMNLKQKEEQVYKQPMIIFWSHTELSDKLKDIIQQLINGKIQNRKQLIEHNWFEQ